MVGISPIVSVSKLSKRFNGVQALDDVSLEFKPGISGLIGPNGAGKTTLLKILLGLLIPDSGRGSVFNYDVQNQSLQIRRKIGVLHERPSYPKRMTVFAYLSLVQRLYRSSTPPSEILSEVNLSHAIDRKIGALSAGMHQRLGIAQALIGDPELVILDEPTSNLDVRGRDELINLIVEIYNETGVSFLVS